MSPKTLIHSLTSPRKDPRPAGPATFVIRRATSDDAAAIERLAQLDAARAPSGAVLVAEVGGEPWAALSMDDLHAVADPFRPSGELVWQLVERARGLEKKERRDGRRARRFARPAFAR